MTPRGDARVQEPAGSNGLMFNGHNARLKAYGRKLGLIIPKVRLLRNVKYNSNNS